MKKSFRDFYDKDLDYFYNEELRYEHPFRALINAKYKLRMYANLFTRDIRKVLLNESSLCVMCKTKSNLQIDHIIPIYKGGKNHINNVQILCRKCNTLKSDKI